MNTLVFFSLMDSSVCLTPNHVHAFIPRCGVWAQPPRMQQALRVSSTDNGVPSVTTVRITEQNRGTAAVMPVQGRQQEAVAVDSAAMKLAFRQTDLSSVGNLSMFGHVEPTQ